MPSRIVREGINSSSRVNRLSPGAELLYRRLLSVADDYGRFHASPATLRGSCWPTCPDKVTDRQVAAWLLECTSLPPISNGIQQPALITVYVVDGARYLVLDNFGQKVRTKSKFPVPPPQDASAVQPDPPQPDGELPADCPQPADSLPADCPQNVGTSRISYFDMRNAKADAKAPGARDSPPPKQTEQETAIAAFDAANRDGTAWWALLQELWSKSGIPLSDADWRKALHRWNQYPGEEEQMFRWCVQQFKEKWRDVQHTPQPHSSSALGSEGWRRVAGPRLIPTAADIQEIQQARRVDEARARRQQGLL